MVRDRERVWPSIWCVTENFVHFPHGFSRRLCVRTMLQFAIEVAPLCVKDWSVVGVQRVMPLRMKSNVSFRRRRLRRSLHRL